MSINLLFQKANKLFLDNKHIEGLNILKEIWFNYPKNTRLNEEINKNIKKFKQSIIPTFSQKEIDVFFQLHRENKTNTVIENLEKIYKQKPNDILLTSLLGTFYALNKNYVSAIILQKKAIEKAPFEKAFYINLSETLKKNSKVNQALSVLYIAKILSLRNKQIDFELAKLNTDLKNYNSADLIYQDIIKGENVDKEIIYNYCSNLIKQKKENEAILYIEKIKVKDDMHKTLLGLANLKLNNFNEAKIFFLEAIELNKNNFTAITNLGNCYELLGFYQDAENCHKKSLIIQPNNKLALNNLAALNFFNGDIDTAENLYVLSIEKNEKNYDAKYYLAQCQLAKSNYKDGWVNFSYRWLSNNFNSATLKTNLPKFKIGPEKHNLLLWSEQGIGDQILFLRFLKDINLLTSKIYLEIDERLHPIIKRLNLDIEFYKKNDDMSTLNIKSQLPIGDLGSFFLKEKSYFNEAQKSYIVSDKDKNKALQKKINSENKLKCGISWISKNKEIGSNKSLTLEALKPILSNPNIYFIDLQYNDTSKEREDFYKDNNIKINKIEEIDNFKDIDGITTLIDICDFIITISNSNAHISGALGKKTFLLLPKGKGSLWYWTSQNYKSVWYPSIQIIEQEEPGSWDEAIIKLSKIIKENTSE